MVLSAPGAAHPDVSADRRHGTRKWDPWLGLGAHETIYQSIYVQGRGELHRELARCLRTGRAKRRPRVQTRGHIPGMVMLRTTLARARRKTA